MTELPRRQQNRIEPRTRDLDAALQLFAAQGYSGATMDAVRRGWGLTKPTLYSISRRKNRCSQAMMLGKRDRCWRSSTTRKPAGMVAICTPSPGAMPIR
jgi:hypothetical protein